MHATVRHLAASMEDEMRDISAKCGHVKRRLIRNERLTGKVLQFAFGVVEDGRCSLGNELADSLAKKLAAGETLTDYELHVMVDVLLLHKRLGCN